jgi:phosphoadenosine phosphosulfate reductase
MDYARKIDFAIRLLRSIPQDGPIEVSYSGGKDSDVILELAKMAGIPFEAIYKQTTIDPPGTTSHAKEMGATIIRPKKSFFQLVEEKGTPSRWKRFCCEDLKEYKIYDRAIQGIRREESTKRAKNYKEPEICRVYSNKEKVRVYLPILEWTLEDVARFIEERGIKLAPTYYDEQGKVHYERRLGCIGCPLKADCGRADFLKYPKFLREYIKHYQVFLDNHKKDSPYRRMIHSNAYYGFFYFLFTNSTEEFLGLTDGLLPDANIDPKEYLENYFKISL